LPSAAHWRTIPASASGIPVKARNGLPPNSSARAQDQWEETKMSIRAGASWGAIVLSAGLLAYAAQPASANLLTNGDFATCPPPPVNSGFAVATPATHDRWNGNGWLCTSTPTATENASQYARQIQPQSTSEILQGVPLAGQCVPAGSSVKLSLRYVNQGPGGTSLPGVATLYSFATGGTWSQFPVGPGWPMTNQTSLGTVGMPVGAEDAGWSAPVSVTAVVPANAVALGVALRMGYQGSVTNIGNNIHGVDDVSLTLASFPASVNVDPDTLNLRARGNDITTYISVPDCLSAGDIDGSTVKLTSINGNAVSFNATRSNLQGSVLMVKFSRQAVQAAIVGLGLTLPAVVPVTIEGELEDGTAFTATDTIRVINP
jgi:hypothetical protein